MIELPARWVIVSEVRLHPDPSLLQPFQVFGALSQQHLLLLFWQGCGDPTRNDDNLGKEREILGWLLQHRLHQYNRILKRTLTSSSVTKIKSHVYMWLSVHLEASHSGWQHESHVISVDHGENTDGPGCDSPRVLESQLLLARPLGVLKHNLKHLGEVLAQMVGRGTLRKRGLLLQCNVYLLTSVRGLRE